MSYAKLLKHPKWQRKRLEALEAKDFTCEMCRGTETTLHVHHGYYDRSLKPWEYPIESLHVVCEDCHPLADAIRRGIQKAVASLSLPMQAELASAVRVAVETLGEAEIDRSLSAFSKAGHRARRRKGGDL